MLSKPIKKLKSARTSKLGFTLIELLVVFTLISIISGLGFASFASYSNRQSVYQAAANVKQSIDIARFNAVSLVKPAGCGANDLSSYIVHFCSNVSCIAGGYDYEVVAKCGALSVLTLASKYPKNVTAQNPSGPTPCGTITFNSVNGINSGIPCEIDLVGPGNQFNISIGSNGYVAF